jgi:hypothetical protein
VTNASSHVQDTSARAPTIRASWLVVWKESMMRVLPNAVVLALALAAHARDRIANDCLCSGDGRVRKPR